MEGILYEKSEGASRKLSLFISDEFGVYPVAFGGVGRGKADLAPVAVLFEYIDILSLANGHNDVGGGIGLVADVDGGVGGDD